MLPVLYSFRRCPYAIRARLAIAVSEQQVELREIELKHKPEQLLAISPNKTIPVLQIKTDQVLDESLDIMVWALCQHDPEHWLTAQLEDMLILIDENDFEFKPWLDKYKYADRHPEQPPIYYQEQCEEFLMQLEDRLSVHKYLFANQVTLADMAIFPFIRQFAAVDSSWFERSPYSRLQAWLDEISNSELFLSCMHKYPSWLQSQSSIAFPTFVEIE